MKPNTFRLTSLILIIVSIIWLAITYILELQDLYWLAWTILGLSPFVIFILWGFTLPSYESGLVIDPQSKTVTLKKRTHGNQSQLKIERYVKTYTKYNPSKTIFTSATVGGITTGGFHKTQAYYSTQASGLGGYYLATTDDNSFIVEKIWLDAQLTKAALRDNRVSHLVKNNALMVLRDSKDTELTSSEKEILKTAIMSGDYALQQNITERAFSASFITKEECKNVLAWICENEEENLAEQKAAVEARDEWRRKTKIPFIATAISIVAISLIATAWILFSSSSKYNSAEKHFRNENYLKAAEIYESLGDYSNSKQKMFDALLLGGYYRDKTEIVIPDGVTSIPVEAFRGYDKLKSVMLPDSVSSIGKGMFKNCTNLEVVNLPDGLRDIENEAFYGCTSLKSITIPDSVISIGNNAFYRCSNLKSITIPDSVISIGNSAFENCSNLTSVTIPDSVTSIDSNVFYNCTNLTSAIIPDSVTSIGSAAFKNCTNLTSVIIPDSVALIGSNSFENCTNLTSVTIPDSVTSIGSVAFKNCTNLTSVIIPASVTSIGANAFEGCENLIIYTELESRPSDWDLKWNGKDIPADVIWQYAGEHGVTNDGIVWCAVKSGVTILGYNGNNSNVVIPKTINNIKVTSISAYAFYRNTSLENISIPEGIIEIGYRAFSECSNLTNINIPEGVIEIGSYAFSECSNLTNISIPNSITYFGADVFSGCESLLFESFNGAKYLGNKDNPYLILYKGTGDCSINDNTKIIAYKAFYDILSLKSITIPNSVTVIGDYAFAECSYLWSVRIGNSVTTIGAYAFSECYNLISITLGDSVTTIGSNAFYGCRELSSIIIPNSVTSIGRSAFSCCFDLKNVTFKNPTGWKYIYYDNKSYTIDNLSDTSVAAEYLTNKYDYHDWKRS